MRILGRSFLLCPLGVAADLSSACNKSMSVSVCERVRNVFRNHPLEGKLQSATMQQC